jgi:hypothetical protein
VQNVQNAWISLCGAITMKLAAETRGDRGCEAA